MSGFDPTWLALREPADRAARDRALVEALARHVALAPEPLLVDIGCGTGSTWRQLSARMPGNTDWLLLDHDPALLAAGRQRVGADPRVRFRLHDLNDIGGLGLGGVAAVTASALFDLCSDAFCAALVARIAEHGCGFYAALNYDGRVTWSDAHPLDRAVVAAFNRHQRSDKGFGPALGPEATACLTGLFEARGYHVVIGDSSWRMDREAADLQAAFLEGFRRPLTETGDIAEMEIGNWLSYRMSAISVPGSLCEVGHKDLFALPA
jgi:SAM-dependent methyltransferase